MMTRLQPVLVPSIFAIAIAVTFSIFATSNYLPVGLLTLLLAGTVAVIQRNDVIPAGPVNLTVYALSLWWLIAALASEAPWTSHLAYTAFLTLPLACFAARAAEPRALELTTAVIALATIVVGLHTLEAFAASPNPDLLTTNRNNTGGWLAAGALFACAAPRGLGVAAAVVAGMACGWIGSRGVAVGYVTGAAVLSFAVWRHRVDWRPVAAGIGAFVLGALALTALQVTTFGSGLATFADPARAGGVRWTIWRSSVPIIEQWPLLGAGPGMTAEVWQQYRDPAEGSAGFHLHNDYLQFAAEGGIVAGLLLLALAGAIGYTLMGRRATPLPLIGICGGAAALMVMAHSAFTFNMQMPQLLLLVGIGAGMLCAGDVTKRRAQLQTSHVRVVACTLALWFGGQTLAVGLLLPPRPETGDAASVLRAFDGFERVLALRPDAAPIRATHADLLRQALRHADASQPWRNPVYDQAERGYSAAIAANRFAYEAWLGRAVMRFENPDHRVDVDAMVADLRTAITLRPSAALPRYLLARHLVDTGREAQALEILRDGLRWKQFGGSGGGEYVALAHELAVRQGEEETLRLLHERVGRYGILAPGHR